MAGEVSGSCHCGGVQLKAPHVPPWVVQCGCSICSKLGVLWAYYPDVSIRVAGKTTRYVCNARVIGIHHCPVCGCTTHWKTLGKDFGRMALNARLLSDIDLSAISIRAVPGPSPSVFADIWPPR